MPSFTAPQLHITLLYISQQWHALLLKAHLHFLMVSNGVAPFHMSAAGVIQHNHLYNQHEHAAAYDSA